MNQTRAKDEIGSTHTKDEIKPLHTKDDFKHQLDFQKYYPLVNKRVFDSAAHAALWSPAITTSIYSSAFGNGHPFIQPYRYQPYTIETLMRGPPEFFSYAAPTSFSEVRIHITYSSTEKGTFRCGHFNNSNRRWFSRRKISTILFVFAF